MTRAGFWLLVGFGYLVCRIFKSADALITKEKYTFAFWDGGLFRAGKSLTRAGVITRLCTSVLLLGCFVAVLAGVNPDTMLAAMLLVIVAGIVLDRVFTEAT